MNKILFIATALFISSHAHALEITMYENKAPLNTVPVERVVVNGEYVQINTEIHPCSSYPGFPDAILGDVYSCSTNRSVLNQLLGDEKMLNLSDYELTAYLLGMNTTLHCETASKPPLISYHGEYVYWFSGPLIYHP